MSFRSMGQSFCLQGNVSPYDATSFLAARSHVPSGDSLSLVPCSYQGVYVQRGLGLGVTVQWGLCQGDLCRGNPQNRKAGSTHPTGMLACYKRNQSDTKQILIRSEIVIIDLIELLILRRNQSLAKWRLARADSKSDFSQISKLDGIGIIGI